LTAVFGHRGACGYLPENTIESMLLAVEQGVDGIEFDVIPTRDGELLIRHENNLALTTDIASRPEFSGNKRQGIADGRPAEGWFAEDFERSQLLDLRAVERLPELRPESHQHSGKYGVPTLRELLANSAFDNHRLIIEVKHGKYFQSIGLDPVKLVSEHLQSSDWQTRGIKISVESFNYEIVDELRAATPDEVQAVFLTMRSRLPAGATRPSAELLARAAADFGAIGIEIELLYDVAPGVHPLSERITLLDFSKPRGLVEEIQQLGAACYIFTARSEFAVDSVTAYYRNLVGSGADAIFADQPDQLLAAVRNVG
jgi:glycerophosphoryl diester phosphodiesterase